MLSLLAQSGAGLWMPEQASTYAADVDWLFYFTLGVSVFFFVLIGVLMVLFAIIYRQKDKAHVATGATHSTALEVTWTAIPIVIVLAIFYWGFKGYLNMAQPSSNAIEIIVTANQWNWSFTYPNGAKSQELHLPADRPVKLVLESRDVLHSLYVPAFRMKKDVVPGRYNNTWVESPWVQSRAKVVQVTNDDGQVTGEYDRIAYPLYCTEYCGTNHSQMSYPKYHAYVYQYDDWKAKLDELNVLAPPIETGQQAYVQYGCNQCHSVDGSALIGPSWKDMYNSPETHLVSGQEIEDWDQYIRESILNPQAEIVAGFESQQMSSFKGSISDDEIRGLIEYMKSISTHYEGPLMDSWDQDSQGGENSDGAEDNAGENPDETPGDDAAADQPMAAAE